MKRFTIMAVLFRSYDRDTPGFTSLRIKSSNYELGSDGTVTASSFVKSSGTSSQFLKADGSVDSSTYLTSIATNNISDEAVTTAKLAADCVTGAKIADNAINSEHYTDGSIDTAHIADEAVTYAKIQNVSATNRILGRDSAGSGDIEEITPANVRTMLNVANGADVTGSNNAAGLTGSPNITVGIATATKFVKSSGTSSQFKGRW